MLKKIEKINGENGKFALVKYTSLEKCNNKKILIVPDFGKKGDHYFDLIYYLAFNGYAVTCLETENNVGEGDGYITNASLCIYEQNLKKVLNRYKMQKVRKREEKRDIKSKCKETREK